ncbi:septum site-determining protein Ssd [Nocardioides sp. KR10-350]|uniref:septum site-determining protein Ssd n=1 Tax=Nocardioides cheoyonin TaxID=3156615 RepID=UPI0032B59234
MTQSMAQTRALLVTSDPLLLEELARLAAAAGASAVPTPDVATALPGWARAPLVLVGPDLLPQVALLGPPRRHGVYVVSWGSPGEEVYRPALHVGAEGVLELPGAAGLVGDLLTDLDGGRSEGVVVGVVGGSGGAGATTFAAALARLGAATGPTVLVDADPLGPGVDRVLGLEDVPGVRWPELARTTGRLGARSLREALPRSGDLGLLGWDRGDVRALDPQVAREVLSAARRGHELVVLDLPRSLDAVAEDLLARCDLVLLVVSASVTGIAAAGRLVSRLPDRERARLVVRGRSADPEVVGRALGVPVLTAMPDQRGLSEAIDLGLGPVRSRRGPLGRAALEVLARCRMQAAAA